MTDLTQYQGRRGGQAKISIARLQRFIGFVGAGLTLGQAAKGIGIGDQTRMRWMRRGRLELVRLSDAGIDPLEEIDPTSEGWPTPDDWTQTPPDFDIYEWPFVVFAIATEKALANFEATQVRIVQAAARGGNGQNPQWQAAAWLLERRFPELYGRAEARLKQQVDVTVQPGAAVGAGEEPVSVEDLEGALLGLEESDRERASKRR